MYVCTYVCMYAYRFLIVHMSPDIETRRPVPLPFEAYEVFQFVVLMCLGPTMFFFPLTVQGELSADELAGALGWCLA